MSQHLNWLFFDVGGTLLNEEKLYLMQEELILQLLNDHGCEVTEKEFASATRAARRHYLPRYASHLIWIFTEKSDLYEEISRAFTESLNKLSYKKYAELVYPMAEIKDMCLELSQRYQLGLIGNQPALVRRKLADEGILPLFEVQALSAEMGLRKPDLRFFLSALAMAHCSPSEAAMIGDRLDNDIYPGRALGMTTVRLKTGPHRHQPVLSPEYLPHYTVKNTHELCKLLTEPGEFVARCNGPDTVT